jgi:flagellar motor switch protein FliM
LLGHFSAIVQEQLARFFEARLNPRYGTSFELGAVDFSTRDGSLPIAELPGGAPATAGLAVALDRAVLLRILECRYGRHGGEHPAQPNGGNPAKLSATASERRIAAHLGAELRELLADCIGREDQPSAAGLGTPAQRSRSDLRFSCRIDDAIQGEIGHLHFTLDAHWQTRVFVRLSAARSRAKPRESETDLPARLPVRLAVRLMETGMPIDDLLKLTKGAVIPVQIGARAQVLAGATPLFTAQVAEDNGRLCLTAFEDME